MFCRLQKCVFVLCVCLVASVLAGCHINWKQPGQCASTQDCPAGQECNGLVCIDKQQDGTCRTSNDCGGRDCVAQKCVPSPTPTPRPRPQPPVDAGPTPDVPAPDAAPDNTPDNTPDSGPDTTPDTPPTPDASPTGSACIAGATQACRLKCGNGVQRCLSVGMWSACEEGGPTHSGWYTPS